MTKEETADLMEIVSSIEKYFSYSIEMDGV